MDPVEQHQARGELVNGLLYFEPERLHAHLNAWQLLVNKLGEMDLWPGSRMREKIKAALR